MSGRVDQFSSVGPCGHVGATAVHHDEQTFLDQACDRSPHGGPSNAVHLFGKRLLGWQSTVDRERATADVRRDVISDLLPDELRSVMVDPVSAVTPCHGTTVDTPLPA